MVVGETDLSDFDTQARRQDEHEHGNARLALPRPHLCVFFFSSGRIVRGAGGPVAGPLRTGVAFFVFIFYCLLSYVYKYGLSSFPARWPLVLESFYVSTAGLTWDSVGPQDQKCLPFLLVIFSFALVSDVFITSHLIQTE